LEYSKHCLLRRLLMDNDDEENHSNSTLEVAEGNNTGNFLSKRAPMETIKARPSIMKRLF